MVSTIKSLLKLSSWTLLTLIFGAIITKVIATIAGPSGVGYFSLFRQLQQTFVSLATFSGDTALVQGISSRENSKKSGYVLNTGKIIIINVLIISLVSSTIMYFFEAFFLEKIGLKKSMVLYLLLIPSIFASLSVYLVGVLNGYENTKLTTKLQTTAAFCGLLCAIIFVKKSDQLPYILILSTISICIFFLALFFVCKLNLFVPNFDLPHSKSASADIRHFFSISTIALLVGFSGAGTLLLVRLKLTAYFGVVGAGIFDAAWTLSSMYLVLFLGSFGTYFLPKLSALKDNTELNKEVDKLMHLSLLVSVVLIVPVIYLKPILFKSLYSNEFADSLKIFKWMLIGDYFKITAWVLSIPMLARAYMKPYFILSIAWNIVFMSVAYVFTVFSRSIEFVGLAYLITQILYVFASYFYWSKYHSLKFSLAVRRLWLFGLFAILFYSIISWNHLDLNVFNGGIMIFTLLIFLSTGISKVGREFLVKKYFQY